MVVATLALMAVGASTRASAQDANQQAYKSKREELVKELQQAQAQLADIRSQRVQLQARIENVIAQMMQQRAQALLMSNEMNALQQLDAMLTSSQDNLVEQRDRFTTIANAVRRGFLVGSRAAARSDDAAGGQCACRESDVYGDGQRRAAHGRCRSAVPCGRPPDPAHGIDQRDRERPADDADDQCLRGW